MYDIVIDGMQLGMHTVTSATGSHLSSGQKQRLLTTRALAAKSHIPLLDEATSPHDNRAQATVSESLDRLQVACIATAHRHSTVGRHQLASQYTLLLRDALELTVKAFEKSGAQNSHENSPNRQRNTAGSTIL